jgi:hypothetical protein
MDCGAILIVRGDCDPHSASAQGMSTALRYDGAHPKKQQETSP